MRDDNLEDIKLHVTMRASLRDDLKEECQRRGISMRYAIQQAVTLWLHIAEIRRLPLKPETIKKQVSTYVNHPDAGQVYYGAFCRAKNPETDKLCIMRPNHRGDHIYGDLQMTEIGPVVASGPAPNAGFLALREILDAMHGTEFDAEVFDSVAALAQIKRDSRWVVGDSDVQMIAVDEASGQVFSDAVARYDAEISESILKQRLLNDWPPNNGLTREELAEAEAKFAQFRASRHLHHSQTERCPATYGETQCSYDFGHMGPHSWEPHQQPSRCSSSNLLSRCVLLIGHDGDHNYPISGDALGLFNSIMGNRCSEESAGCQCRFETGHTGMHATMHPTLGTLVWGKVEGHNATIIGATPTDFVFCTEEAGDGSTCVLQIGHDGDHKSAAMQLEQAYIPPALYNDDRDNLPVLGHKLCGELGDGLIGTGVCTFIDGHQGRHSWDHRVIVTEADLIDALGVDGFAQFVEDSATITGEYEEEPQGDDLRRSLWLDPARVSGVINAVQAMNTEEETPEDA